MGFAKKVNLARLMEWPSGSDKKAFEHELKAMKSKNERHTNTQKMMTEKPDSGLRRLLVWLFHMYYSDPNESRWLQVHEMQLLSSAQSCVYIYMHKLCKWESDRGRLVPILLVSWTDSPVGFDGISFSSGPQQIESLKICLPNEKGNLVVNLLIDALRTNANLLMSMKYHPHKGVRTNGSWKASVLLPMYPNGVPATGNIHLDLKLRGIARNATHLEQLMMEHTNMLVYSENGIKCNHFFIRIGDPQKSGLGKLKVQAEAFGLLEPDAEPRRNPHLLRDKKGRIYIFEDRGEATVFAHRMGCVDVRGLGDDSWKQLQKKEACIVIKKGSKAEALAPFELTCNDACMIETYSSNGPALLEEVSKLKEFGNASLKLNKAEEAIGSYSSALRMLEAHREEAAFQKPEDFQLLLVTLYSNKAQAHLIAAQCRLALHAADAALRWDPSHGKSIYRKACALRGLGALDTLSQWLQSTSDAPSSGTVKQCLRKLLEEVENEERVLPCPSGKAGCTQEFFDNGDVLTGILRGLVDDPAFISCTFVPQNKSMVQVAVAALKGSVKADLLDIVMQIESGHDKTGTDPLCLHNASQVILVLDSFLERRSLSQEDRSYGLYLRGLLHYGINDFQSAVEDLDRAYELTKLPWVLLWCVRAGAKNVIPACPADASAWDEEELQQRRYARAIKHCDILVKFLESHLPGDVQAVRLLILTLWERAYVYMCCVSAAGAAWEGCEHVNCHCQLNCRLDKFELEAVPTLKRALVLEAMCSALCIDSSCLNTNAARKAMLGFMRRFMSHLLPESYKQNITVEGDSNHVSRSGGVKDAEKDLETAPLDPNTALNPTSVLSAGVEVEIIGIQSRPELNRMQGKILSFDENRQRYGVQVPGLSPILIKSENIRELHSLGSVDVCQHVDKSQLPLSLADEQSDEEAWCSARSDVSADALDGPEAHQALHGAACMRDRCYGQLLETVHDGLAPTMLQMGIDASNVLKTEGQKLKSQRETYVSRLQSQQKKEDDLLKWEARLGILQQQWKRDMEKLEEERGNLGAWASQECTKHQEDADRRIEELKAERDKEMARMRQNMRQMSEEMRAAELQFQKQIAAAQYEQWQVQEAFELLLKERDDFESETLHRRNMADRELHELRHVQHALDRAESELQVQIQDMKQQELLLAAARKDVEVHRQRLQELQSSICPVGRPDHWECSPASTQLKLIHIEDSALLSLLQRFLECQNADEWLGHGRDLRQRSDEYNHLLLCDAWRVENLPLWKKYMSGANHMQSELNTTGMRAPRVEVRAALHRAAEELPGLELHGDLNEKILLHGTTAANVLPILQEGMNERLCGRGAYGFGLYLAEDAGKCDQYVDIDTRYEASSPLHQQLFNDEVDHAGNLHWIMIVRVALGYAAYSYDSNIELNSGSQVWASERGRTRKRELAVVPGSLPPFRYHSMIMETSPESDFNQHRHRRVYRYREFISTHSERVYPEYLLGVRRCQL